MNTLKEVMPYSSTTAAISSAVSAVQPVIAMWNV
jgi:hypothetical protein